VDYKKIKNKHCCERIRLWIKNPDCPFVYVPHDRYYGITVPKWYLRKNEVDFAYANTFCPSCGTKFPSDLSSVRYEILKNEYGIEDSPFNKKQKKLIPKEFKTEEWWRKRGL